METRKVEIEVAWMEPYVPPRCRKARNRLAGGKETVRLAEYALDEAPVAFVIRRGEGADGEGKPLRLAGGRLYEPTGESAQDLASRVAGFLWWFSAEELEDIEGRMFDPVSCVTREALERMISKTESDRIIFGGEFWKWVEEPRYVMQREGGKVIVKVSSSGGCRRALGLDSWNALQLEEVVEEASRYAAWNGIGAVKVLETIEVLIPEAVRSDRRRDRLSKLIGAKEGRYEQAVEDFRKIQEEARDSAGGQGA